MSMIAYGASNQRECSSCPLRRLDLMVVVNVPFPRSPRELGHTQKTGQVVLREAIRASVSLGLTYC